MGRVQEREEAFMERMAEAEREWLLKRCWELF